MFPPPPQFPPSPEPEDTLPGELEDTLPGGQVTLPGELDDVLPPVEEEVVEEYPPELIEQIINELSPKPPVTEGEEIPMPEFEEPELELPADETINVRDSLLVRPKTVPRVSVPPGTRLVSDSQIPATRVALSEGSGDDVYGTPEEEQQPVWNIRSLKLRRALRI